MIPDASVQFNVDILREQLSQLQDRVAKIERYLIAEENRRLENLQHKAEGGH